jgi:hypothetical protein|tara:strand:+ start:768 stop:1058 length:291 start_codon:yes stop_codon:yes gene_type:complete
MKTTPTHGMPFEMYQAIQASQYGHPNVYPNSEHIKPPMEKERIRVVEQATRTEIKLAQTKAIEERYQEIQALRDQAKLRYETGSTTTVGEFIDIEV